MSEQTIFEKILSGEVPCNPVFENDTVYAFKDINPMAKEHFLFIHKDKTTHINDMADNRPEDLIDLFEAISHFTQENGMSKSGFRVVTNLGDDGGQTVHYTHLHVLGGERLGKFGA
jgi:histidine triad (HIT) family protein